MDLWAIWTLKYETEMQCATIVLRERESAEQNSLTPKLPSGWARVERSRAEVGMEKMRKY